MRRTLIVGGTSRIAGHILPLLMERGDRVTVLTGRDWEAPPGVRHALVELSTYDGSHTRHWIDDYDTVISIAPLHLACGLLDFLNGRAVGRAVFLSSNNAALLKGNPDYDRTRAAEQLIAASATETVILQPTLISGRPGDPVIGYMLDRMERGRRVWLPGLDTRQHPIDYRDVGRAMLQAAGPGIKPGTYSVSGPEALTYRDMMDVLQTAVWRPARALGPPSPLARLAGRLLPLPNAPALRRAGVHRDPVNPALPGFVPAHRFVDMVHGIMNAVDDPARPS